MSIMGKGEDGNVYFRDGVGNVWEMAMERGPQYGQVSRWASVSFYQDDLQILMRRSPNRPQFYFS